MFIRYHGGNEIVAYAAAELEKYLHRMMPDLDICIIDSGSMQQKDSILLGTLQEFGLPDGEVKDDFLDDLIDIRIDSLTGVIAGSNPRSILIGVYRFLRLAGCRWIHPGDSGEIIPEKDIRSQAYSYRKLADHRFRGQVIEGAVSYTHVRDAIRYLPKVGMNLFWFQFVVPYNMMCRWYRHLANTRRNDENVTFDEIDEMLYALEKETKRCGLQLHTMGHGYLFEPYGIHYRTAQDKDTPLTEEARQACALVKGVRGLYEHSLNYTQLCYSDPDVRRRLTEYLVKYAKEKPYIDVLHISLADAANNHCECEECVKRSVSDWYVMLLNEIDEAFTQNGIDMKLAFTDYNETLWPPVDTVLKNPKRFIMCANLARPVHRGSVDMQSLDALPPYVRNNKHGEWPLPMKIKGLKEWKKLFDGPSYVFEYYFYTAQYNDPGSVRFAKIIWEDVQKNHVLGLDGVISCQTQRFGFPYAFAHYVLAEALFDRSLSFDAIRKEFFEGIYGKEADRICAYLEALSEAFMPWLLSRSDKGIVEEDTGTGGVVRHEAPVWQYCADFAESLSRVPKIIEEIQPLINMHIGEKAWNELGNHAVFVRELAEVLKEGACGRPEAMQKAADELLDRLSAREEKQHPVFDLFLFDRWLGNKVRAD